MANKYIPLGGSALMFLAFFSTIRVTLTNPTDTNIIISVALIGLAVFSLYKFFKTNKPKQEELDEEFTPVAFEEY